MCQYVSVSVRECVVFCVCLPVWYSRQYVGHVRVWGGVAGNQLQISSRSAPGDPTHPILDLTGNQLQEFLREI